MRYRNLLMGALLLAVTGCDDDGVSVQNPEPAASVRFINAVPDTGVVSLRFVDKVENLPTLLGVPFRSHSGFYQRVTPGARNARVFPSDTLVTLAPIMLVDTTVTLTANNRYTVVYAGRAAGNQDRLAMFEDGVPPTPPANSIAIKVLHAMVGTGNVDVYITPSDTAGIALPDPITGALAVVEDVPYLGQSAYVNVPTRPDTGPLTRYQLTVTAANSPTPIFTARPGPVGIAALAGETHGPQPGIQISGSVLTAVLVSGSIPGTRQAVSASPTAFLMVDKVLNP
jgi:hypothetical protein